MGRMPRFGPKLREKSKYAPSKPLQAKPSKAEEATDEQAEV